MLSIIAIVDFAFLPFLHEDQRLDHLIQGIVILVIVICNIALATFQEVKANNALESLQKTSSPTAKVLRDGKQQIVLTKDLVIGDIVLLEEGMIVPADIRLFEANSLKIEEAALTGESLPSEKDVSVVIDSTTAIGDRANFAFASTIVTYGSGIGIVSATGMNTEIGKIAKLLSSSGNKEDLPPLKKKINKLTKTLT
jgi:Ca2+-transporting ATPase